MTKQNTYRLRTIVGTLSAVLLVIAVLSSFVSVAVLPIFIAFELLIGFIQAYVFFMLTIAFISLALPAEGESHAH